LEKCFVLPGYISFFLVSLDPDCGVFTGMVESGSEHSGLGIKGLNLSVRTQWHRNA
jgi:hypothetical protein